MDEAEVEGMTVIGGRHRRLPRGAGAALDGWEEAMGPPDSVAWLVDRLAARDPGPPIPSTSFPPPSGAPSPAPSVAVEEACQPAGDGRSSSWARNWVARLLCPMSVSRRSCPLSTMRSTSRHMMTAKRNPENTS